MQVLLVHGYLAPAAILWPIGFALARARHAPVYFDYPSRRGPFERHVPRLRARLAAMSGPYAVVAHSMGGLLLHTGLLDFDGHWPTHIIHVAVPHAGSAFARRVDRVPLSRAVVPALAPATTGVPTPKHFCPVGTLAGERDTVVRPDEARLAGASHQTLPFGHNELLLRPATAAAILHFLQHGAFAEPG
jgi:alpha-beta hydrolase superfamily lysophospholipase